MEGLRGRPPSWYAALRLLHSSGRRVRARTPKPDILKSRPETGACLAHRVRPNLLDFRSPPKFYAQRPRNSGAFPGDPDIAQLPGLGGWGGRISNLRMAQFAFTAFSGPQVHFWIMHQQVLRQISPVIRPSACLGGSQLVGTEKGRWADFKTLRRTSMPIEPGPRFD